jgi:hypothetical protein
MTGIDRDETLPACYGELETVFPTGQDGLRSTPETCLECSHKTECLRSAMEGYDGLKVQEEFVDRAYNSGILSFFERWSKKKNLNRKKKDQVTQRDL